jgi:hypothetical protein
MSVDVAAPERIVIEELAPEPSTAAQVVGEIVGSFILASVGLGSARRRSPRRPGRN